MKIATIVGARPQFVKASALSIALTRLPSVHEVVIHTGQHFDADMSDQFIRDLGMRAPDYQLGIHGGTKSSMVARTMLALEPVITRERPDAIVVYGDANPTLAGALVASALHIPLAHVEAGMRAFDRRIPEEDNRLVTDRLAAWFFTVNSAASNNLLREGIDRANIHEVGDVMYDVALRQQALSAQAPYQFFRGRGLSQGNFVLATIHRAANTDDGARLRAIVQGLLAVNEVSRVVWPLHPRTRKALAEAGLLDMVTTHIHALGPMSYTNMAWLEQNASVVVTDSGGVQKEAFFYRVPGVVLRDTTEWMGLVDSGWSVLVPPRDPATITARILHTRGRTGGEVTGFGMGDAAGKIAKCLTTQLQDAGEPMDHSIRHSRRRA